MDQSIVGHSSVYPDGYFKVLYDAINYVNYLSFVDFVTGIVCLSGFGFFPILLFNIWIEAMIEIIVIYKIKYMASDTRYWSVLWPGCKGIL